jgi:hypothetical protein
MKIMILSENRYPAEASFAYCLKCQSMCGLLRAVVYAKPPNSLPNCRLNGLRDVPERRLNFTLCSLSPAEAKPSTFPSLALLVVVKTSLADERAVWYRSTVGATSGGMAVYLLKEQTVSLRQISLNQASNRFQMQDF